MKKRKMSDNFKGPDGRSRIFVILFNVFLGVWCWVILLAAIFAAFMCLAGDAAVPVVDEGRADAGDGAPESACQILHVGRGLADELVSG